MANFIISTGQPIGAGAYQPEIVEVYVSYEPNGAITDLTVGVTFDSVKNEFVVPVDTSIFTFNDNGVEMMGLFVNGEWVFIDHFDVSYEPNGAITDLTGGVTFKITFDIPDGVDSFTFNDDGVAMMCSLVNGEWEFIDHFDVSYEPNGAITDITSGVTFDSVKNEFVVPVDVLTFTFTDDGVAMICSLVDGEWVFIDHFDVSYEPNGAITGIMPSGVTFDSVKNEFVVPIGMITFNFTDDGVAMRGLFVNGEWVFIDHFDVSYEPNGAIINIAPSTVTFDSAKNEFVVPAGLTFFNFNDDGVAMMGLFVNGEWVFIDHFDVSYEPNGAIANITPPTVTFDSAKNEFVVPADIPSFTFDDDGVAMRGLFVNGEWVLSLQ
jgi:RNase P/RNase MRP subunit p29